MSILDRASRIAGLSGAAFAGYAAYAWYATRRFENLDPAEAGAPGSFLEVDGQRVHYIATGEGEPVVLIHGWNGSAFSFRHTIPELAPRYRVVAPDLIGFGYSDRPAHGDYSLTGQAGLVAGVMDRLGIERAAVIGHSMGGGVAMRLALRHPERVTRLALVDSVTVAEQRRAVRFANLLRPLLPLAAPFTLHRERFRRAAFRSAVHDPARITPETLEGYFRPMHMRGHLRALAQQLSDRHGDELLAPERIEQPVLVLWGEQDRWLPVAHGEELVRQLPHAEWRVVPCAGHLPLEEQAGFCNRALLAFLEASPAPVGAPSTLQTRS